MSTVLMTLGRLMGSGLLGYACILGWRMENEVGTLILCLGTGGLLLWRINELEKRTP